MRRLRLEAAHTMRSIGIIIGAAFIFAFAGTLLWVNGRGAWFVMRYNVLPSFAVSLSWTYIFWLAAYGLAGASVPISVISGRLHKSNCIPIIAAILIMYSLMLIWQPLFYSAQFILASLFILIVSAGANIFLLVKTVRISFFLPALNLMIFIIQAYFICFTVGFAVLN